MSEQIATILRRKLEDLAAYGEIDSETRQNALKEELQFYVLNFIYHHPEYGKWIMYGGSALRIIHGLDRMSVDLDFEVSHAVTGKFLEKLKKEIEDYFLNAYGAGADFLTVKIVNSRGLLLKFHVGKEISFEHSSKHVHVKIDLNYFAAPKTVTERRPINYRQFSFVILTYNMSALMASKIAAIFLREQRGIDKSFYDYKGRDIYDLLWYMSKPRQAVPDLDYLNAKLRAKGAEAPDIKTLFDKLTIAIINYEKMDELLREDLVYLFEDRSRIENWLKNWRESYLRLLDDYKIRTIKKYLEVYVVEDLAADIIWFKYMYETEDSNNVMITYAVDDLLVRDDRLVRDIEELPAYTDIQIDDSIKFSSTGISSRRASKTALTRLAKIFYQKTDRYFKKTSRVIVGDNITTKVIRMTADNFNPKEQIILNKSTLPSCELDDLLR